MEQNRPSAHIDKKEDTTRFSGVELQISPYDNFLIFQALAWEHEKLNCGQRLSRERQNEEFLP